MWLLVWLSLGFRGLRLGFFLEGSLFAHKSPQCADKGTIIGFEVKFVLFAKPQLQEVVVEGFPADLGFSGGFIE